ncbi:MAG: HlyD family secretion protein [Verrucomicrobiota bacterium]
MSQSASAVPHEPELSRDENPQPASTHPSLPYKPRWRKFAGFAIMSCLAVAGAWHANHLLTYVETDDAYVTSSVHPVNARISGVIAAVVAEPNTEVKAGDILFRLDPREHEIRFRQAEAQLEQADAVIEFTKAQLQSTHAKIDQTHAEQIKIQADFARAEELIRSKVSSKKEYDAAQAALDSVNAILVSAKASALGMEHGLQVAIAQRKIAQIQLENAQLLLSHNIVKAPVSGRTSRRNGEVGAYVQPGQTLIAIVEPSVWIEANFKETQLTDMQIGQSVEISIDALPGHRFRGVIESFAPASGAQFAMLPPDNATGNFTKVVQRIPVRIRFDNTSIRGYEDQLRAGLSSIVAVRVKSRP